VLIFLGRWASRTPTSLEGIMKAYILIREDVPLSYAMVASAHASLAMYLKFKDTPEVQEWLEGPFYKVICKVDEKEFERAKTVEDHVVITESALEDQEVAAAFKPRSEWPKMMQFLRLYR
jgi:peptidyl-tRNA hydrolase